MVWVMVVRACKLLGDRFESLTSVTLLNEKLDVTSHVIPKEIGLNMVEWKMLPSCYLAALKNLVATV